MCYFSDSVNMKQFNQQKPGKRSVRPRNTKQVAPSMPDFEEDDFSEVS